MKELSVNVADIQAKLGKLKVDKSPGLDLLYPRVLRETCAEIAYPLTVIFSKSLATGCVPTD